MSTRLSGGTVPSDINMSSSFDGLMSFRGSGIAMRLEAGDLSSWAIEFLFQDPKSPLRRALIDQIRLAQVVSGRPIHWNGIKIPVEWIELGRITELPRSESDLRPEIRLGSVMLSNVDTAAIIQYWLCNADCSGDRDPRVHFVRQVQKRADDLGLSPALAEAKPHQLVDRRVPVPAGMGRYRAFILAALIGILAAGAAVLASPRLAVRDSSRLACSSPTC